MRNTELESENILLKKENILLKEQNRIYKETIETYESYFTEKPLPCSEAAIDVKGECVRSLGVSDGDGGDVQSALFFAQLKAKTEIQAKILHIIDCAIYRI